MKTKTSSGLKVNAAIKAGGMGFQHARGGLKVKAAIKAGGMGFQHARGGLKVKAGIKAGSIMRRNHTVSLRSIA